ncbi:hypothetical protein V8G54_023170 [Vigna mungo]|uniref:Uncharacterized protein n=1 Tax=Vigna mungo TaxID=3915 RepID=A0AAQ3RNX7_VIGMU
MHSHGEISEIPESQRTSAKQSHSANRVGVRHLDSGKGNPKIHLSPFRIETKKTRHRGKKIKMNSTRKSNLHCETDKFPTKKKEKTEGIKIESIGFNNGPHKRRGINKRL